MTRQFRTGPCFYCGVVEGEKPGPQWVDWLASRLIGRRKRRELVEQYWAIHCTNCGVRGPVLTLRTHALRGWKKLLANARIAAKHGTPGQVTR